MINLVVLLACAIGQFQAAKAPPALQVTAELVGQGRYACNRDLDGYYVKLAVKNTSAASRKFFLFSCSWQDCWTTDKPLLALYGQSCRMNIIQQITLQAGQQLNFYGFLPVLSDEAMSLILKQKIKRPTYTTVRFAFTELTDSNSLSQLHVPARRKVGTVYWSNVVPLTFTNNDYQVQPLPAH